MNKRPLRPFEQGAHLHVLDWAHDTARARFEHAGRAQVTAATRSFIAASAPASGPPDLPSLEAALYDVLRTMYGLGHATVRSELRHQESGQPIPIGLSAYKMHTDAYSLAVADFAGEPGHLRARARLAMQHAAHAIWQAVHRGRLQGVSDPEALRTLGEDAGHAALRAAASSHAGGAINSGRAAAATGVIGARYTSVLDKNTCGPCEHADTGELYALDDPALPPAPNPACLGGDRCRCIHVYQLAAETGPPVLPMIPQPAVPIAAGG